MSSTPAKSPFKIAEWSNMNGFDSSMVKDTWFRVAWPKSNSGDGWIVKNELFPFLKDNGCLDATNFVVL